MGALEESPFVADKCKTGQRGGRIGKKIPGLIASALKVWQWFVK